MIAAQMLMIAVRAAEISLSCPPSIQVDSKTAAAPPAGWEAHQPGGQATRALTAAGFTDGHPKDNAVLRPASATRAATQYKFPADYPDGVWISCSYRDTTIFLTQKLPSGVKSCVIQYRDKPVGAIASIRCQTP
jgi:hypothetical protein